MTLKRTVVLILALLLCTAAVAETADAGKTLSARTFQFRHKLAENAATIIKSLMSPEGTMAIQPSSNALVVTDKPENLKAVAAAIAAFDSPPQLFRLSIQLVTASRVAVAPKVPAEMKDVAMKLAMLRYNAFESLGLTEATAKEGDPGLVDLASGYRAEFRLGEYDPTSDSVKVNDLRISRFQGEKKDQLTQLIKTSLNLKIGQTVILGASRAPQSERALMMVVSVRR